MPRFDGTGPNGEGSMTGRKLGNCNEDIRKITIEDESNPIIKKTIGLRNSNLRQGLRRGMGRRGNN